MNSLMQVNNVRVMAGLTPALILSAAAALCLLGAWGLWVEIRAKHRAPDANDDRGCQRAGERAHGSAPGCLAFPNVGRSNFSVQGKTYTCRILYFFRGNWHQGGVGKRFDFQPGQQVGVYYDPLDPRRHCALMLDKPHYDSASWTLAVAAILAILAIVKAV